MSNLGEIGTFALDGQRLRERRRHQRTSVLSQLGELVVVTLGSERGLLLTVSASGISIQAQAQLTPGSHLPVQFSLPFSEAVIRATCDVVWVGNNCDAGLKLLPLAESEQRSLENWLALHAAEPEDVLAETAHAGISCAVMDEAVPASSTYADLEATVEMLVAQDPPHLDPPYSSHLEPEATATPGADTLESLLSRIVVQARVLTQAEGTALVLRSDEELICRASSGNAPVVGSRLRPGAGLSAECFRLGQVVRCDDVENDSRVNAAAAQRLQSRSILIAPIKAKGSALGVLQVLSTHPFAFNNAHAATLEHLAGVVAAFLTAGEKTKHHPEIGPSDESASEAPLALTKSAAEPEVADAPGVAVASKELAETADAREGPVIGTVSPSEEAVQTAGAPEASSEPLGPAEEQSHSAAGLRRYGTIACLGLFTAGSLLWTMIRIPQPSRASLPSANTQPISVPAKVPSVIPPPVLDHDSAKASKPARVMLMPHRSLQAAEVVRVPHASRSKLQPVQDKKASALSLRTLPTPVEQANGAAAAPMISALASPTPDLVTPAISVRQSAGVERGRAVSQPKPVYPQAALRAGIEGSVVVATTIGTDGKIKKVNVVSGHPLLAQAAMDAVRQWRYQPSYLNGAPVEVDSTITLNFKRP